MPEAISNTSPLPYLYRISVIEWLSELFGAVWTPRAVVEELWEGRKRGYDVPERLTLIWLMSLLSFLALLLSPLLTRNKHMFVYRSQESFYALGRNP